MQKNQKIGLLFALVAVALWAGCGFSVGYTRSWLATSTATHGKVVSVAAVRSHNGKSRRYCPTVTFRTAGGQQITFESDINSNPPTHKVNDLVDVRYQIAHPTDARIDEFFELWMLPLMLSISGIFFMIPGFILTLTKAGQQTAFS